MRIALVILHADPSRGGAERYTVDLATGLRRRGEDVSMLASSFSQNASGANDPLSGVTRVLLPARGATRLGSYNAFLDSLDLHLASNSYDIVHAMLPVRRCDIYHPHAGIAAEGVARGHLKYSGGVARAAAMLANRVHLKRRRFAAVERALLTGSSNRLREGSQPPTVLCLSEYVKRDVIAYYPKLAKEQLATLFNAVDLHRFDPENRSQAGDEVRKRLGIAPGRVVALMIAQDYQRKGLREAILAVRQVNDPNLVLLVVGKQPPGAFGRLASELGLGTQVIFAGATTDPYSFYRAADFLVLPTRHDPCSLVVLEALAMGLPVISTVFNGACEIMTQDRHGFVLPDPSDLSALAESIRQLSDPEKRRPMQQACLDLRPRLSYDRHLDELTGVYGAHFNKRQEARGKRAGVPNFPGNRISR